MDEIITVKCNMPDAIAEITTCVGKDCRACSYGEILPNDEGEYD